MAPGPQRDQFFKNNCVKGTWIAEWSSHSTTMNIGTLRPGPWGRSLVTTILFRLKHNIYARKNFQKRWSEKEAERTIINTIIC